MYGYADHQTIVLGKVIPTILGEAIRKSTSGKYTDDKQLIVTQQILLAQIATNKSDRVALMYQGRKQNKQREYWHRDGPQISLHSRDQRRETCFIGSLATFLSKCEPKKCTDFHCSAQLLLPSLRN